MWLAVRAGVTAALSLRVVLAEAETPAKKPAMVLRQATVVFRHGARTPLHSAPWSDGRHPPTQWEGDLCDYDSDAHRLRVTDIDPSKPKPHSPHDEKQVKYSVLTVMGVMSLIEVQEQLGTKLPGGCSAGQLTRAGRVDTLELGQRLHRRYIQETQLISPTYNSTDVFCRSTNLIRTVESVRMVLAGLFPNDADAEKHVVVGSYHNEVLYPNHGACPRLRELLHRDKHVYNPPSLAKDRAEIAAVFQVEPEKVNFVGLRDVAVATLHHNKVLPDLMHDAMLRAVDEHATLVAAAVFSAPETLVWHAVCSGPMLAEILAYLDSKSGPKLALLSAHDTSVMPLLICLGIFDNKWPRFAADLAFELYEDTATHAQFVVVRYNDHALVLPGCTSEFCPLSTFKAITGKFIQSTEARRIACTAENPGKELSSDTF